MKPSEIRTLNEFANFLNESDDYPVLDADEIIERNGWQYCKNDYDVCSHNGEKISLMESGKWEVVPDLDWD